MLPEFWQTISQLNSTGMKEVGQEKLFYRLTALWAFSESYLGGILHGLHLPVTGILLGSFSIICINTIFHFTQKPKLILKATVLVILVKFSLSPHSPPPAYVAVAFQGILSFWLFWMFQKAKWVPFVLAPIALMESAIQRFLMLWIWFGKSGMAAFQEFLQGLENQFELTVLPLFYIFLLIYGLAHLVAGLAVAILISRIKQLNPMNANMQKLLSSNNTNSQHSILNRKTRRYSSFFSIALALFVVMVSLMYLFPTQFPGWDENKVIKLTVRLIFIFALWWLLIVPLFQILIQKAFFTAKNKYLIEIQAVTFLLPEMNDIIMNAWRNASSSSGFQKIPLFMTSVFAQCIFYKNIE